MTAIGGVSLRQLLSASGASSAKLQASAARIDWFRIVSA
jgi:hypothetical protein